MTSMLRTVRDKVSELWSETEPLSVPNMRYRPVSARAKSDGVISPREFYFTAPSGGRTTEFGSLEYTVREYGFNGVVRLSGDSRDFFDLFDAVVDEANLLVNVVNLFTGWPAGVRKVRAADEGDRWRTEPVDGGDFEIVIPFVAEVEETDGA